MPVQNVESLTEEQIQQFLTGSETIKFRGQNRAELYGWVERVLVAQEYATRGKKQRGAVRAYIVNMTGLSLPQATRLIRQYRAEGVVEAVAYRRRRFPVKYTSQDVARLAEVDRAHGWLSGPATVRIFRANTNSSARPNMRAQTRRRFSPRGQTRGQTRVSTRRKNGALGHPGQSPGLRYRAPRNSERGSHRPAQRRQ